MVAGNASYINNDGSHTYSISSTSNNVAGGNCSALNITVFFIGYATNRTAVNYDSPPTIQVGVSSDILLHSCSDCTFRNIIFDGNTAADGGAQTTNKFNDSAGFFENVTVKGFDTVVGASTGSYAKSIIISNSMQFVGNVFSWCIVTGNTPSATSALLVLESSNNTIVYSNTGATADGVYLGTNSVGTNLVSYGNGRDNFATTGAGGHFCLNCISDSAVRFDMNVAGGLTQ